MFELHFIELIFTIFHIIRYLTFHLPKLIFFSFFKTAYRRLAPTRTVSAQSGKRFSTRARCARHCADRSADSPPFCKNGITHSVDTVHFLQGTPNSFFHVFSVMEISWNIHVRKSESVMLVERGGRGRRRRSGNPAFEMTRSRKQHLIIGAETIRAAVSLRIYTTRAIVGCRLWFLQSDSHRKWNSNLTEPTCDLLTRFCLGARRCCLESRKEGLGLRSCSSLIRVSFEQYDLQGPRLCV